MILKTVYTCFEVLRAGLTLLKACMYNQLHDIYDLAETLLNCCCYCSGLCSFSYVSEERS